MNLKTYQEFLLESLLLTSNPLYELIKKIDDPVAQKFTELVNKDIKTKYNLIDLTDTNDKLAFMPDSQVTTKLKSGQDVLSLFQNLPNTTTIGRVFRGILKDNGIEFTEKEIEKFVNKFKSSYDSLKIASQKEEPIKVVRGEDIRFWYLNKNYCQETLNGRGSLGKSCMRYPTCQPYLDIYVNNPDQVGLVIYLDENQKLKSRALIWNTDKGPVLDRIYYTDDSDVNLVEDWARKNFEFTLHKSHKREVKLTGETTHSDGTYAHYPYMDQFMYYYAPDKTLYNYEPEVSNRVLLFELQDTGGGGNSLDLVYCEIVDESYPSNEVVWSGHANSYMPRDTAVYSNYESDWLWSDDAVYSEWMSDYLIADQAVKVYLDIKNKKSDWYPEGDDSIFLDEASDNYYLIDLAVEDDEGTLTLETNILTLYTVQKESIADFKKLYDIQSDYSYYYATETDEKLFGIKLDKSKKTRLFNKTYFKSYWTYAILDKIEKQIPENTEPWELKYDKQKELEQADEILSKSNKIFDARNRMYQFGGVKQFITMWQDSLNERLEQQFLSILHSITVYRTTRRDIYQEFEKKVPDFLDKLRELVIFSLEDPQDFFLAFHQSNQSDNQIELKQKFYDAYKKILKLDDIVALQPVLDYLIISVYKNVGAYAQWSSIRGLRWFKHFDVYLKNQNDFQDVKQ